MDQRKRATASRLINCPFQIWGKKKRDETWHVEIKNVSHNHEPSKDMSAHPSCRRFSEEEFLKIKEMTLAGVPARQILSALRQNNPNIQAISKTIYNAKAKVIKEIISDRTVLQALFEELSQGDFIFDMKCDKDGHLTHMFFAHPKSIALTKSYGNIFVMDCIYKTNKYQMPLLHIVGVTSFNTSFYSCFAFIQKEEEEDYVWVLQRFHNILGVDQHPLAIVTDRELALVNAIEVVFPRTGHLLCLWHIEKNILAKCKKEFDKDEDWDAFLLSWTKLIESPNVSNYEEAWHILEVQYREKEFVLCYIKKTWLPFKEKFVYAWTGNYAHFGNRVTSRVEGAHAMIKKYLHVSTGNLREVKEKICLAIENQYKEIKTQLASEKIRVPHKFRGPLFKELVTNISGFALREIFKQYELSKSDSLGDTCTGHFTRTMGMPCAHMMRNNNPNVLRLCDIHLQWRIDIRSSNSFERVLISQKDKIEGLLEEFRDKYLQMSLAQREDSQNQIAKLLDSPFPSIIEPIIQPHK